MGASAVRRAAEPTEAEGAEMGGHGRRGRRGRGAVIVTTVVASVLVLVLGGATPAGAVEVGSEAAFRAAWANAATTSIELTTNITLTCAGGTTPTRNSVTTITLEGNGRMVQNTCNGADQGVLRSTGAGGVIVRDVTIAGGRGTGVGAGSGLDASGFVNVQRSNIVDNDGFGVRTTSAVFVGQSTVSDNGDTGIAADDAEVSQSTASGNGEDGVDVLDEALVVLSTVHGNGSTGIDGPELGVVQSTVTGNRLNLETSELKLANSAVGESTIDENCDVSDITSFGGNLVDDTTCDLPPGEETAGSLGLGPLQANGGPTTTRLPSSTSPLLDRITVDDCDALDPEGIDILGEEIDQRDFSRPGDDAGCDTGAVERCTDGTFADVSLTGPFARDICWMGVQGITTGFATTPPTYRPSSPVSRQAMSAFMFRLAGSPPFVAPGSPTFSDVPVSNQFFDEIEWMADEGITTGFATTPPTYRPSAAVSRQAMSAFMRRLADGPGVGLDV